METIIISLGGSLIVPEEIDVKFLKDFKELILAHVLQGKRFVLVAGGGRTCRKYQGVAKEISNAKREDLDWIGIATNNLNAELLRAIFGEQAHEKVIIDLSQSFSLDRPIIIGGALEPGHSSDFDAVEAAKTVGAKKIINISNIDYVYDSDPKINPNAKKFEVISWSEYRELIPKEWIHAGMNSPFDPVASMVAQDESIQVIIMNGKPLDNLAKCLDGEKFMGTIIS